MADVKLSDDDKAAKKPTVVKEPATLLNTVPTYTEPKEYVGVDLSGKEVKEPVDTTKTERPDLLSRLHNALEVAPPDVVALIEARLAHLVYEAESRVPGLV